MASGEIRARARLFLFFILSFSLCFILTVSLKQQAKATKGANETWEVDPKTGELALVSQEDKGKKKVQQAVRTLLAPPTAGVYYTVNQFGFQAPIGVVNRAKAVEYEVKIEADNSLQDNTKDTFTWKKYDNDPLNKEGFEAGGLCLSHPT